MRRLAFSIPLVAALVVGILLLIPQLNDLSAMRRERVAAQDRFRAEFTALQKANNGMVRELADIAANSNPEAEAAAAAQRRRRAARMAALSQLARVLGDANGTSREVMRLMDILAIRRILGGDAPELKTAIESYPMPAFALTTMGYWDWPEKMPDGFGALFAISAADVDAANRQVAKTKAAVEDAMLAATSVEQMIPDQIVLRTAAVPWSVANSWYEEFAGTFRRVLGEDGYDAFARLNGLREVPAGIRAISNGPEDFFASFGAYGQAITIDRSPDGRYNARFEWPTEPGVRVQGTRVLGTGYTSREALLWQIGFLSKRIPAGF